MIRRVFFDYVKVPEFVRRLSRTDRWDISRIARFFSSSDKALSSSKTQDATSSEDRSDGDDHVAFAIKRYSQVVLGLIALIFCLGGIAAFFLIGFEDRPRIVVKPSQPSFERPTEQAYFVRLLRDRLQAIGADDKISIALRPDKGIEVKGQLSSSVMPKWQQILQWYDQQNNAPILFNFVTQLPQPPGLPEIKFVSYSQKDSYVILTNGRRVEIGETLAGGWQLRQIESNGIVVSLSDRILKINFD